MILFEKRTHTVSGAYQQTGIAEAKDADKDLKKRSETQASLLRPRQHREMPHQDHHHRLTTLLQSRSNLQPKDTHTRTPARQTRKVAENVGKKQE